MSYPQAIENILEALNNGEDWTDVYQDLPKRDRDLTEVFCSLDCSDFIAMDGNDAYLFIANEQTGVWKVEHVGRPIYEVEPEMIGDSVDLNEFLTELRYELPGVEVKCKPGAALSNMKSEFVQHFKTELNRAFQNVLDNCF